MHYHNISGCLFCVRQLWRGQSQDEVISFVTILAFFYMDIFTKKLNGTFMSISGSLPRPLSDHSLFGTTLIPRVWMYWKIHPASTVSWRSFVTSLTLLEMPSFGSTSSLASDFPSPNVHQYSPVLFPCSRDNTCSSLFVSTMNVRCFEINIFSLKPQQLINPKQMCFCCDLI